MKKAIILILALVLSVSAQRPSYPDSDAELERVLELCACSWVLPAAKLLRNEGVRLINDPPTQPETWEGWPPDCDYFREREQEQRDTQSSTWEQHWLSQGLCPVCVNLGFDSTLNLWKQCSKCGYGAPLPLPPT